MSIFDPIAIVGMAGLFPRALDIATYWSNICAKIDATAEVSAERWIAAPRHMVSRDLQPDKAYSSRCCLLPNFKLDPRGLDLPSELLASLDPLHQATLRTAREALEGADAPKLKRERTGVVMAALVLPTDASSALTREVFGPILEGAVLGKPASPASLPLPDLERYFSSRVAGLPAAVVAKAFALGGGSYTLDAACASSLYAVKLACDELRGRRADAMLAGGVARPDCLFTQVGFSQLRALSPRGRCAPFDGEADGLVVGEGAGLLVLKRLEDALREGDRIWGLIRGIGLSNDLRGNLLAPDPEGQLRAMRAAYAAAGWLPADVDLIECHGAGTPVGDATEMASLTRLWGDAGWQPGQCAIGSVKSMIGHLLTAAGAAGMIKTLLAMNHGILPPTINFRRAPSGSALNGGPFRVQTECAAWERRDPGLPRRAAVSAFGFGGTNAHLLLEEWMPQGERRKAEGRRPKAEGKDRIFPDYAAPGPTSHFKLHTSQVAITGMAACFGKAVCLEAFWDAALAGRTLFGDRPASRWKGCDAALPGLNHLKGCFLEDILIERGEFHIPPLEIPDILPQHLLMLKVAAAALANAGLPLRAERPSMGAIVGIDFDFEATNFHLRWYLEKTFPQWRRTHFARLSDAQATDWLEALKDACAPPLNASRTLGALGSMVASRIAREFRFGGSSFVVSGAEASGLRALQIGLRSLQAGELDSVLVGAVDLCGDLRSIAAQSHLRIPATQAGSIPAGEGAAALVIKRLDDALAHGDRVYAVIRGIGAASGGGLDSGPPSADACFRSLSEASAEAELGPSSGILFEAPGGAFSSHDISEIQAVAKWSKKSRIQPILGSTPCLVGRTGAVQGLAATVKAALCLHHEVIPPLPILDSSAYAIWDTTGALIPQRLKSWPPDPDSFHRAIAGVMTYDGNSMHVVLQSLRHNKLNKLNKTLKYRARADVSDQQQVRIPVGGKALILPPEPSLRPPVCANLRPTSIEDRSAGDEFLTTDLMHRLSAVSEAITRAHSAYLEKSAEMTRAYAEGFELQHQLIAFAGGRGVDIGPAPASTRPLAFSREQCLEFARGSAARVLGPEFAEVDRYSARVRLPDEPLMLVDRILDIRGEKASLGPGRIVTEHDVLPGTWYLDGGRAPVCISVEAGQADLFLCAYLGIDLAVRGLRTYRLLDATVEFHRELPRPGETIRYDIQIEKFIRQGDTYLFLFRFEGTINGRPLISMTNGCAGFFTPEEAVRSGGILLTDSERQPQSGILPAGWHPLVPMVQESFDDLALEALRTGDLAACFGERFQGVRVSDALKLPGGRMRLIDRVLGLDPEGGRYGLGRIRAKADIHPDDWFLTCHFVDDMVMPGTLMYECCVHALRVLIQRMGWISERPEVGYEPVPGIKASLKCRGPVTPQTRQVVYEVDIKALGYGPPPFVIADANIYADGQHIVRFSDMSLQLSGATYTDIESFWSRRLHPLGEDMPVSKPAAVFSRRHFEEFARGRPSLAFGEPYAPYDAGRFIARLPSPPYLFMDRIMRVEPAPWTVRPGGWVEAEVDVSPEAWYIAAERTGSVPYCVLLETALQPCGWLAAYMGSALKNPKPLHFRNLGGQGILHREARADIGTLRTRIRMTQASEVADMIIEHFDFEIHAAQGLIYSGSTYFGFFAQATLERQEGLREAPERAFALEAEPGKSHLFLFSDEAPLTPEDPERSCVSGLVFPSRALRMIDRIELFLPEAGPRQLGVIRGSKEVDPQDWFFQAHFFQDPVWPGSLGLESFLQLLKFAARQRWPQLAASHRFACPIGRGHRWTYRGQILPANRRVAVEAAVTEVIESPHPALIAEGFLMVDGLPIYRMEEFGIRLVPLEPSTP